MAVTVEQKTKMYDTPENTSINEAHGIPSQNPDAPSEWGWQSFLTLINHLGVNFSQIKGVAQSATNPGASKVGDVWFWGDYGSYPYFGQPVTEFNQIGFFLRGASSWSKYTIKTLYSYSIKDGETGETIEKQLDDVTRYNSSTGNFELKGESIRDATITLNAFSQAVLDYIGSGGTITNNPDERHLDKFTDGVEKLRVKDGFEGKTYLYNPGQYATAEDLKTAVEALVAGGDVHLVIDENVDGGGLTWTLPTGTIIDITRTGYLSNVDLGSTELEIVDHDYQMFGADCTFSGGIKNKEVKTIWFESIDNTNTNDISSAINDLISYLTSNQNIHFEGDKTYRIDSEEILVQKDYIGIYGHGCNINHQYREYNGIGVKNYPATAFKISEKSYTSYVDADMSTGSDKIIVDTSVTVNIGDLVEVMDNTETYSKINSAIILDVNDELIGGITKRVITIDHILVGGGASNLRLKMYSPTTGCNISGFNITCNGTVEYHYQRGIEIGRCIRTDVSNNKLIGLDYASDGILDYGHATKIHHNWCDNFGMRPYIMTSYIPSWGTEARGYGIIMNGKDTQCYANKSYNCRHSIATGISYSITVYNNKVGNSEFAFRQELAANALPSSGLHCIDSHQQSYNSTFYGNEVTNCITEGMSIRCDGATVVNNTFNIKRAEVGNTKQTYYSISGISIDSYTGGTCDNHIISNNKVHIPIDDINTSGSIAYAIDMGGDSVGVNNMIISNNILYGKVRIGSVSAAPVVDVKISDNYIYGGIETKYVTKIGITGNTIVHGVINNVGIGVYINTDTFYIEIFNNNFENNSIYDKANQVCISAVSDGSADGISIFNQYINNIRIRGNKFNAINTTGFTSQEKVNDKFPEIYSCVDNEYESSDVDVFSHLEYGRNASNGGTTSNRDNIYPYIGMKYINTTLYYKEVWNGIDWVKSDGYNIVYQGSGTDQSLTSYTLDLRKYRYFKKTIGAATTFTFDVSGFAVGTRIPFTIWCEANAGVGVAPSYAIDSTGTLTVKSKASNYDNTLFTVIDGALTITDDTDGAEDADIVIYETSA